jgi:signal transduction histidine kinase
MPPDARMNCVRMTLIHTAAQFALRSERSTDEVKDSLRKILHAAKRCTDLINQLLWLARSDAAHSRVELVSTDVVPVVSDVAGEAATLAADKRLTIATELPGNCKQSRSGAIRREFPRQGIYVYGTISVLAASK